MLTFLEFDIFIYIGVAFLAAHYTKTMAVAARIFLKEC